MIRGALFVALLAAAANADELAFDVVTGGGRLRVFVVDGTTRTLIRNVPETRGADRDAILSHERTVARQWQRARERLANPSVRTALERQDDWLETAHRLEELSAGDPDHLGVLRDLVVAYGQLLGFEGSSALGTDLLRATARRLAELEQKAAPLDAADRVATARTRAWLFSVMDLPPLALEALRDLPDEQAALRATLKPLGQGDYQERRGPTIGATTLRCFTTVGAPPDPVLLWGERWYIASVVPGRADRTVAWVLARRGDRYYLLLRTANRSELASLYGARRPTDPELDRTVGELLRKLR